jgi:hypothetical protein
MYIVLPHKFKRMTVIASTTLLHSTPTMRARGDLPPKIVPVAKLVPAAGSRITAKLAVQGDDIRVSCVV